MNEKKKVTGIDVGFIGCGHMASAIIKGVIKSGFLDAANVRGSEVSEEFAKKKRYDLGIEVYTNNKKLVRNSNVVVLATKPNYIKDVIKDIKEELTEGKLIISIAAGVNTKTIEEEIGKEIPVVRVMPNAPAMILEGMSGIVKGKFANESHIMFVKDFLSNIGKCIVIDEDKIDILTAISGSGPAFFYKTINEIARAGEKLGLEYEKALLLSMQTALGSAKLMLKSELTPEELINGIATKGGCTQVGVDFMESANSKDLFYETIKRTAEKAKALG